MKQLLSVPTVLSAKLCGRRPALACVPLPAGLNFRDSEALTAAVAAIQPDTVIHLAAQSFVPASPENPRRTFDINFMAP